MAFYKRHMKYKFLKLLFLFSFILFSPNAFAQQIDESCNAYKVYEKLPFSTEDSQLTLDLFVPNKLSKSVPCIIVIQGGGFKSQDGQRFRYFAEYIAENNYVAALISYRGQPDFTYNTTMNDIKSAVRYVKKVSAKYSIDSTLIGATGRSAGATLAALLAVADNDSVFGKTEHKVSSSIQAAVLYAGVFDFVARFNDSAQIALQPDSEKKILSNGAWIGTPFSNDDKNWNVVSTINHLDKNDPPLLLMHCKDDKTVPWLQTRNLYNEIEKLKNGSEVLYFENGGHGFHLAKNELYLEPMMTFFKKQFD